MRRKVAYYQLKLPYATYHCPASPRIELYILYILTVPFMEGGSLFVLTIDLPAVLKSKTDVTHTLSDMRTHNVAF